MPSARSTTSKNRGSGLRHLHMYRDVEFVKDWKVPLIPGKPVCEMNRIRVGDSDDTHARSSQLLQEVEDFLVHTEIDRIPARRHFRVGQIQGQADSKVVKVALGGDPSGFKGFELVVNAELAAKCRARRGPRWRPSTRWPGQRRTRPAPRLSRRARPVSTRTNALTTVAFQARRIKRDLRTRERQWRSRARHHPPPRDAAECPPIRG